jgi:hypothetical protein
MILINNRRITTIMSEDTQSLDTNICPGEARNNLRFGSSQGQNC